MIEKLITALGAFVISVISAGGYLGVVGLMAIESACIPLPSEVIMPFSGYLVHTGRFNLWLVAFVGAIGCNVGSAIAYAIGSYGGRPLVERYGTYVLLSRRELDLADHFFSRYGDVTVLISRMLPVVRTFIALPAGISRMPQLRFHFYTFIGSFPWCLALAYLGMKAGQHWQYLGKYFHEFDKVIGAIIILGIVWFLSSRWRHRVRSETNP
ncbi:MAG TPA: DedA family protein [Terriglobales bacterium]|nr:DedA family protein [Terriglobales bacterium]